MLCKRCLLVKTLYSKFGITLQYELIIHNYAKPFFIQISYFGCIPSSLVKEAHPQLLSV